VTVSWVLRLVCRPAPVEVEKEVWFIRNLALRYLQSAVGEEGRNVFGEACCGRVVLRGGADQPKACQAATWLHLFLFFVFPNLNY